MRCGALLADLRAGRVTDRQALDALAAVGVDVIEPLAGYLRRFLVWVRTAGIIGQCDRCGAEYHYATRAELETDDAPCDAAVEGRPCGGGNVAGSIVAS